MVLSFESIRENKQILDDLIIKYPMVADKNTPWCHIIQADLCNVSHTYKAFYKETSVEKLPYILGEVSISFDELKKKMVKESVKQHEKGKKIAESDYQEPYKEVEKLKKIEKLVNKLTKSDFEKLFKSEITYKTLFPSLYRLELDLNQKLFPEILNYIITNEVEVFDDFVNMYDCENLFTKLEIDENLTNSLLETKKKTDIVTESVLTLIRTMNKSNDIDTNMLLKNISEELKSDK